LLRQSHLTIPARKVIWTVYIDEADSHGAPVMAMGGFLCLEDKIQTFN
jgi:hypothetical protein